MSAERRTTVLVADDHAIVKEGLVNLLETHGFDVIGAVGNGRQLIEVAGQAKPDVIVTDLSMPEIGGIDVIPMLRAAGVDSKVIILTMHNDGECAARALRAGASGFLLKESAGDELITGIHEALKGRVYLTPAVTRAVMLQMAAPQAAAPKLTQRQRDVLRLIAQGQRMKEIAASLQLSPRTVETHKYDMMQVLGVNSTAELIRYAIENGLTGPPA